jgi:hypothetical protein
MKIPNALMLAFASLLLSLLIASPAHADFSGRWKATSRTASAITGDIRISGQTLIFGNGKRLKLAAVEDRLARMTPLPEQQLNAIFALVPPSDPKLLHGNTLCGKKVTYIALSLQSENSLGLAAFTGQRPPREFNDDACAVYFYER